MRKILLNAGVIGSVFSLFSIGKKTSKSPRRTQTALVWASWGITFALAIIAAIDKANEKELED